VLAGMKSEQYPKPLRAAYFKAILTISQETTPEYVDPATSGVQ
jgi:hypothetical protein